MDKPVLVLFLSTSLLLDKVAGRWQRGSRGHQGHPKATESRLEPSDNPVNKKRTSGPLSTRQGRFGKLLSVVPKVNRLAIHRLVLALNT